jgi:hypothetical protein
MKFSYHGRTHIDYKWECDAKNIWIHERGYNRRLEKNA